MIEMERHVKPAVILGKATFEQDIVNELIEEVERLRNTGKDAGNKLIGQLHNNEKSKQIDIDLTTDVGKMWKKVMNGVGDKYLTDMVGRLSRSDCFEVWTNHAYAGDYNPYHTHGCNTPAGLSGFMWLSNPQSIEDKWEEWTSNIPPDAPRIPSLNHASGVVDGWTQCIWDVTTNQDTTTLKPVGEEWFKPTVGQMWIFPNWLHHQVYPFFGEGERLSIAMNWNVYDSDEQILMGRSEEQKKQFYDMQDRRKKEKAVLEKAKEDGFFEKEVNGSIDNFPSEDM
jgi:hypothetical protein